MSYDILPSNSLRIATRNEKYEICLHIVYNKIKALTNSLLTKFYYSSVKYVSRYILNITKRRQEFAKKSQTSPKKFERIKIQPTISKIFLSFFIQIFCISHGREKRYVVIINLLHYIPSSLQPYMIYIHMTSHKWLDINKFIDVFGRQRYKKYKMYIIYRGP